MVLTLLSLTAAILCYAIRESYYHGKLKWQDENNPEGFWGKHSDRRKYKKDDGLVVMPPDNWYYRLNKDLKYKEKFPLAGTILVALTDGPHLMQFFMKIFLALSFVPLTGWIWAGVIWFGFGVSFTIFYKIFSR